MSKDQTLTKEEIEDQIKLYEKAIIICKHDQLKQILQKNLKELKELNDRNSTP